MKIMGKSYLETYGDNEKKKILRNLSTTWMNGWMLLVTISTSQ